MSSTRILLRWLLPLVLLVHGFDVLAHWQYLRNLRHLPKRERGHRMFISPSTSTTLSSDLSTFTLAVPSHLIVTNHGKQVHTFLVLPPPKTGTSWTRNDMHKGALAQLESIAPGATKTMTFTFSHGEMMQYGMSLEGFAFASSFF